MKGCILGLAVVVALVLGCGKASDEQGNLPAEQIDRFKAGVNRLNSQCGKDTTELGQVNEEFRRLAEQAASNSQYEQQAPREAAIAYRLYAAHLILEPTGRSKHTKLTDGLPWVSRALQVDENVADFDGLKAAELFCKDIIDGRLTKVVTKEFFYHLMRLGMVEASHREVDDEAQSYWEVTKRAMGLQDGSSPSDDVDYLLSYGQGDTTVRECLFAMRLLLLRQYPDKDVGGAAPSYIDTLPNGNTCVRYEFHGDGRIVAEWEVNKRKGLVVAKSDLARSLMGAGGITSSEPTDVGQEHGDTAPKRTDAARPVATITTPASAGPAADLVASFFRNWESERYEEMHGQMADGGAYEDFRNALTQTPVRWKSAEIIKEAADGSNWNVTFSLEVTDLPSVMAAYLFNYSPQSPVSSELSEDNPYPAKPDSLGIETFCKVPQTWHVKATGDEYKIEMAQDGNSSILDYFINAGNRSYASSARSPDMFRMHMARVIVLLSEPLGVSTEQVKEMMPVMKTKAELATKNYCEGTR